MKTLEDHNKEMRKSRQKKPKEAGVLCDKCKTQMVYKDNCVLRSLPPKRRVICPECSHEGYKVVRVR